MMRLVRLIGYSITLTPPHLNHNTKTPVSYIVSRSDNLAGVAARDVGYPEAVARAGDP